MNRLENAVAKVISHVVDSVDAGLVPEGVGAGDTLAEGGSLLLVGVVDVPVAEGGVAGLVLGPVLGAGGLCGDGGHGSSSVHCGDHWGSNAHGGDRSVNGSDMGGSHSDRGRSVSSIGSGVAKPLVSEPSVAQARVSSVAGVVRISFACCYS